MLIELGQYWLAKRNKRGMPERQNISPADIPRILPYLALVDVFHDPVKFRYRLIGTRITATANRDATGEWLDEKLYGGNMENMLWAFRKCVADRRPVAVREKVQFVDKDWVQVEVLLLPLGKTDERVDMVMLGVDRAENGLTAPPKGASYVLNWAKGLQD